MPVRVRSQTLSISVGPVEVELIVEEDRICQSVLGGKPFEPESLPVWARMCARGGTVLDIGAYTGLYTIAARKLKCRVIAFEPMPFNRVRLAANARLNLVSEHVNSEAVSNVVGSVVITWNPIPFTSGASLVRRKGQRHQMVKTITIDSLRLRELTAMKIDVERAEPMVLSGARETIERLRPEILVEVLDLERAQGVLAALPDSYRKVEELDGRNWLVVPR